MDSADAVEDPEVLGRKIAETVNALHNEFARRLDQNEEEMSGSEYHKRMAAIEESRENLLEEYGDFTERVESAGSELGGEVLENGDLTVDQLLDPDTEEEEVSEEVSQENQTESPEEEPAQSEKVAETENDQAVIDNDSATKYGSQGLSSSKHRTSGFTSEQLFIAAARGAVRWDPEELLYDREGEVKRLRRDNSDGNFDDDIVNKVRKMSKDIEPDHLKALVRGTGDEGDYYLHPMNVEIGVYASETPGTSVRVGDGVWVNVDGIPDSGYITEAEMVEVRDPVKQYFEEFIREEDGEERFYFDDDDFVRIGGNSPHPELIYAAMNTGNLRFYEEEIMYGENGEEIREAEEDLRERGLVEDGRFALNPKDEHERVIWNLTDSYTPPVLKGEVYRSNGDYRVDLDNVAMNLRLREENGVEQGDEILVEDYDFQARSAVPAQISSS